MASKRRLRPLGIHAKSAVPPPDAEIDAALAEFDEMVEAALFFALPEAIQAKLSARHNEVCEAWHALLGVAY